VDDVSTELLPAANFSPGEGWFFDNTTAVCVDKLNRIYIFGGFTNNGTTKNHDSIWYIDLPLPPIFDCSNLTHGSYPHPTDCSSFFFCVDSEIAGEFTCPPSQRFNSIKQTSKFIEEVLFLHLCRTKRLFFHPSDCSQYIGCGGGTSAIEGFDCPELLLFDPVLLKCDLPQFVRSSFLN
jgi:hypothetical protein